MVTALSVAVPILESGANTTKVVLPNVSEVWLTLTRDKQTLAKGSKSQLARIYNYLDSMIGFAGITETTQPLGRVAQGTSLPVGTVRQLITRCVTLLKEQGKAVEVKHDLSGYVDGLYHTAKRGNKILGVTFNPLKHASLDVMRRGRLLQADGVSLALTAIAGGGNG